MIEVGTKYDEEIFVPSTSAAKMTEIFRKYGSYDMVHSKDSVQIINSAD